MIVHTVRLPYKLGQIIKVKPLFDIHYGSRSCDVKCLKRFISEDEDAYFIGGGDWLDSIGVTDPRYTKSNDITESNDVIDEQIDGLFEILNPIKDRILCCGTGNHCENLSKRYGTHPMKRICKRLNIPYMGYSWFVKLLMREENGRGRSVLIKGHHGFGGGRTLGADLTRYSQDMNYYGADVYMYGHTHQKHWSPVERLGVVGSKVIAKPKHLMVCGTFLKTLTDNTDSTYSEIKGFRPVAIGGLTLHIKPNNDWVDMWVNR